MKEVNVPVNKRCKKCDILLPIKFFYKSNKNSDGYQNWCKTCQSEYNKMRLKKKSKEVVKKPIKDQLQLPLVKTVKVKTPEQLAKTERATKLKRLSTYHIHYGLEYEIVGKLKKHSNRDIIKFKCLTCGKSVTQDMDMAWAYRFNCKDCAQHIDGLPTNELVKPDTFKPDIITPFSTKKSTNSSVVHEETFTATCEPTHQNCSYDNCQHDCIECEEQSELLPQGSKDQILEKIKEIREKIVEHKEQASHIHVFIVEVPEYQKEKKGFWNWIKSLFHK